MKTNYFLLLGLERNDQTEQEERREIKQRLNRKVCYTIIILINYSSIISVIIQYYSNATC